MLWWSNSYRIEQCSLVRSLLGLLQLHADAEYEPRHEPVERGRAHAAVVDRQHDILHMQPGLLERVRAILHVQDRRHLVLRHWQLQR